MSVPSSCTSQKQQQFSSATIRFWKSVTDFNRDNRVRQATPPLGTNVFRNSIIVAGYDMIKLNTMITELRSQRAAITQRDIDSNFLHYTEQYRLKSLWSKEYASHEARGGKLQRIRNERLQQVHMAMFEEAIKVQHLGVFVRGADLEAAVAWYDADKTDDHDLEHRNIICDTSRAVQKRVTMRDELSLIEQEYEYDDAREKTSWELVKQKSKANLVSFVKKDEMDREIIVELKRARDDEIKEVLALIEDELLWFHNHAHMAKWTVSEPA